MSDRQDANRSQPAVTGTWRKSSFTTDQCVELATATGDSIALRNSNNHAQGTLFLTRTQITELINDVKAAAPDDRA